MKIVILGDTHFGGGFALGKTDYYTHLNTRLLDFSNSFDYVVDYMINNCVNHFFITGDIFENRRPQASELSLFSKKICRLSELNIHTHIVIGNHDLIKEQSATTLDVLSSLKLPFVHIYSDVESFICKDEVNSINIIFLPFRTCEMLNCTTNEEAVTRISTFLQYEVKKLNNKNPTIVIGHLMVQGTAIGNAVLDASPGEVVLPVEIFKRFNSVIMGHVHQHIIVKKKPLIVHLGSMECKDFGEGKHKKYFLSIESNNNKLSYCFEQLPVRSLFDFVIDQSLASSGKEATDDVIQQIKNFSQKNDLKDSIIRIEIFINEKCLYDLETESIRRYLKQIHKIYYCVGIFPQVVSKRQLRKASITEHNDPLTSFIEYVELEEDLTIRDKMKLIGSKIITDRGKQ
ncbi:MAG: metallophosphoesterase [Patescibacteria group bacterium]|jgi:exonuclease SbcD